MDKKQTYKQCVRCQHKNAVLKSLTNKKVNAYCPECERGWYGPRHHYYTLAGNLKKPPKWVLKTILKQQ